MVGGTWWHADDPSYPSPTLFKSKISAEDPMAVSQLAPLAAEDEAAWPFPHPEDFADEAEPGGAAGKFQLRQSALRCSRHG